MNWSVENAEALAWVTQYRGDKFHFLLSDPPYNIGFMKQEWDHESVAYQQKFWEAVNANVLAPGAFGAVFTSTRTYHRLACVVEDAGFTIHPMLVWVQTQGFPKATNAGLQADLMSGVQSEVEEVRVQSGAKFKVAQQLIDNKGYNDDNRKSYAVKKPSSEFGKLYADYYYGKQALRPSYEPVLIFQKPFEDVNSQIAGIIQYNTGVMYSPRTDSHQRSLFFIHSANCTETACDSYCAVEQFRERYGKDPRDFFDTTYENQGIYAAKTGTKERNIGVRTLHPTLKPLTLTQKLATIFLPPQREGFNRRAFVPFSGVGSEIIGAIRAGWDTVVGVEYEPTFCEESNLRITQGVKEFYGNSTPT